MLDWTEFATDSGVHEKQHDANNVQHCSGDEIVV